MSNDELLNLNDTNYVTNKLSTGFNIENYKLAVHLLYQGNNTEIKRKADQYLYSFEKTHEAWDISINILNTPNLQEEAYFNASQIIKKKLRFDFGNYCENKNIIETLGTFLIEKIIYYRDHKSYLISNLCKCFSLFTVFAHQTLPDLIKVVVNKLNNDNIKDLMSLLLIFNYLAENVNDNDVVVDQSYKDSYIKFLETISDDVIMFLNYLIKVARNSKDSVVKAEPTMLSFFRMLNKNIIECFTNWIEVGLSGVTLSKLDKEFNELLEFVFNIDPENMETYSECICLLLRLPLQNEQLHDLGLFILNKVISFKDR